LGEWPGFHGWQRGVVGKLPAHCGMHFMCNKYIKAENCHTMMHGTAVGVAEAVDTPLLQQPFRNTHRDFYPHLWLYMYTGNFPNHFFLLHFAVLCVQPKQEKRELCKIQASVIFIYERHWTGPENG